jgi:hypothetical protein
MKKILMASLLIGVAPAVAIVLDINPNTGEPEGRATCFQIANNCLQVGDDCVSRVVLPVDTRK